LDGAQAHSYVPGNLTLRETFLCQGDHLLITSQTLLAVDLTAHVMRNEIA
jgi:hypothetical protein